MDRNTLIHEFIDDIDKTEFQAYYRRKKEGTAVQGWKARLEGYFWPKPECDYFFNMQNLKPLIAEGRELAQALANSEMRNKADPLGFSKKVFEWGSVPQNDVTAEKVYRAVQAAIREDNNEKKLMNSGWTKVAAFVTAHLEDENRSQAIWDSRVSWSLIKRMDALLFKAGYTQVPEWLSSIGIVPGRGGTRPKSATEWKSALQLAWPNGYQSWRSHFAASKLIREIRNELNLRKMPTLEAENGKTVWTVRTVEMVLFMDGY